jgi:membrane protease YdiL (CAAX protease family)
MVLCTYTSEQRKDYFRRCYNFRQIRLPYWFFMLVFPILMMLLLIFFDHAAGNPLPGMTNLKSYLTAPITILFPLFMSFLSGPWSEEFGWRGFALDPLLRRFGVLRGSILLGGIWAIWHLPLYFMPQTWHGQMGFRLAGFWSFLLYSIGLTLVMTWVFLLNGHSILSGFVLHLTNNFTSQTIGPYSDQLEILRSLTMLMLGFVLILRCKMNAKKQFLL